EWGTTCLTFEKDPEPFGKVRDANIVAIAREMGITVIVKTSHTLYKPEKTIERNGGKPPMTYKSFQNILMSMDLPRCPPPPSPLRTLRANTRRSQTTTTRSLGSLPSTNWGSTLRRYIRLGGGEGRVRP
ncbi:hypothetical protein Pcinc_031765, partial [Petrolisthes cinctipes]